MARLMFFLIFFLNPVSWHIAPAYAVCANPSGAAGDMIFNADYHVLQWCDGTNWIAGGTTHTKYLGVNFDGTNDYMTQSVTLGADGKSFTGSFWVRRTGGTGSQQTFYRFNSTATYSAANLRFLIEFNAADRIHIQGRSSVPADVLDGISTTQITDSNWHHVAFSVDLLLSDGDCDPAILIYIDGSRETLSGTPVCSNTNIDFNVATDSSSFGSGSDAAISGNKLNADVMDFWFDRGTYIDLTNASNLALFISSGRPVSLGSTGNLPTGSQPELFFSGTDTTWHTNDGSVTGFALTGSLTATTTPVQLSGLACASPVGSEGDIIYNNDEHVLQYCDGKIWRATGPVPGTGGAGCSNPAGSEADIIYNDDHDSMQYCDGTDWQKI